MIRVSKAVELVKVGSWFPPGGENRIEYRTIAEGVVIDAYYVARDGREARREIRFFDVSSFSAKSMPGPRIDPGISFEGSGMDGIVGSLAEYTSSDIADAWRDHFGLPGLRIRHFSLAFLSENIHFDVIAARFEVGDEILL